MDFELITQPTLLVMIPSIAISLGECECEESHGFQIQFAWLIWTACFQFGGHHDE